MNFKEYIKSNYLLLDGAMGTEIQKEYPNLNFSPEILNIENPELIENIHKKYINSGSQAIITNTFGANSYKLSNSKYSVTTVIESAISIAKKASLNKVFIGLNIGPIGQLLKPLGSLDFDCAYNHFKEQIMVLKNHPVDFIYLQTFSDLQELRIALLAVNENSNLPVIASMTFNENFQSLTGTTIEAFAVSLRDMDVDALGINCSLGSHALLPGIESLLNYSKQPVLFQPNAGLPTIKNNTTIYSENPKIFLSNMEKACDLGVRIFGGCCGTTPKHIKLLSLYLNNKKTIKTKAHQFKTKICSYSNVVDFDKGIVVIGERINPTGKKKIKNALIKNDMEYLIKESINQINSGAQILDLNVGIPEIDQISSMTNLINEIQSVLNTPLQIDSDNPLVIEKALRNYCGKAIINSVTGKISSLKTIVPLAKKYGAAIVGLTIDENGLPKSTLDRVSIAEKIINYCISKGIPNENIFIDALTMTVSAQQKEVPDTLNALKEIKNKYNVKTILGTSNISHGLPNRSVLNRTFLTMALSNGLNATITDPTCNDIFETILAYRVLNGEDIDSINYIRNFDCTKDKKDKEHSTIKTSLHDSIYYGYKESIIKIINDKLEKQKALDIIHNEIMPSLNILGNDFNNQKIYLPQLIRGAETVKIAFEILKENLPKSHIKNQPKILLATVEGDVHDIGKNIVKILLENQGFNIIDLGKDVSETIILKTIEKENIKLIGLSSLMTTTLPSMEKTIKLVKENHPNVAIMVGGAVLTFEYSKQIKADFYGKNAQESVEFAKNFFLKGI